MKKKFRKIIIVLTAIAVLINGSIAFANADFGSAAAKLDTSYTLQEMLTYAIQDEYAAQAEYAAIMNKYGTSRPFSNIIRSEATHISLLEPLFEKYKYDIPKNEAAAHVVVPSSLTEAYKIGVDAEIKNIAMYEKFLKEDIPEDVKTVFTQLMDASKNHRKAFENSVSRSSVNGSSGGFGKGRQGNSGNGQQKGNGGNALGTGRYQ